MRNATGQKARGAAPAAAALALALALAAWAGPASAEAGRHDHAGHHAGADGHGGHAMGQAGAVRPVEAGQGAFAALAEIVAILAADPETDWRRVDIGALRRHLVDMSDLVLYAEAQEEALPDGLRIVVSGTGRAGDAVRAMVPSHARELDSIPGWTATAIPDGQDIVLTVTSGEAAQMARIQGLGFFGLMATGAHHQDHHLAIARGQGMHHH